MSKKSIKYTKIAGTGANVIALGADSHRTGLYVSMMTAGECALKFGVPNAAVEDGFNVSYLNGPFFVGIDNIGDAIKFTVHIWAAVGVNVQLVEVIES